MFGRRCCCRFQAQNHQGLLQPDGGYEADKAALSDGPNIFMMRYRYTYLCLPKSVACVSLYQHFKQAEAGIHHFRSTSNLGAMQDSLKGQPSEADIKAMQEVPNRGTAFEGIYLDGPAILGSSVLLSVLLFLSLERVLGLDQWLARARQQWDEKKLDKDKWAVYDARRRLEETFSSTDESADDIK